MKNILRLFAFCIVTSSFAQEDLNIELVGFLETPESANDIWGYVDDNGIEYALVGTRANTKLVSLEDPTNPELLTQIEGANTVWRDLKTWENHIFVTTDGNSVRDGLLVIDGSDMRDVDYKYVQIEIPLPDTTAVDTLFNCHNIFIDEKGFAYLAGCNVADGGIIILDVATDPWNPSFVGIENRAYSHDVFVRDDIMYCSEIYLGQFGIYDVSDRSNPVYINGAETSTNFTHNAWLSDDGNYLFTTDEKAFGYVDAFDISDFNDPFRIDKFRPIETENKGIIPHNTHYHDGFLVTSWYTDGVVITDATRPNNLVKVGSYDTWIGEDGGFLGCWGAYPFLPSGLLLATDRQSGLYVLRPEYTRASYLEGNVTDLATGLGINDVQVAIISDQENQANSNAIGKYRTGLAESGDFDVLFYHPDYNSKTVSVTIESGEVTTLDVELGAISSSEDIVNESDVAISPNPFNNETSITWSQAQYQTLEIYNVIGHRVKSFDVSQTQNIEIGDDLLGGVYIIKMTDLQNNQVTKKIVKR